MSEPIYIDHVPELRSWPTAQRARVSEAAACFVEVMRRVHEGSFESAATFAGLARVEVSRLVKRQRQQASRDAAASRNKGRGLPASAFKRL